MGWGSCGTDSKGRPIGYSHDATCDHPGCKAKIDRGLGYACGGMHGERDSYCEGYFCGEHMSYAYCPEEENGQQFCVPCAERLEANRAEEYREMLLDLIRPADPLMTVISAPDKENRYEIAKVWIGRELKGSIQVDPTQTMRFFFRSVDGPPDCTVTGDDAAMLKRIGELLDHRAYPLTPEEQTQKVYDLFIRWDDTDDLIPDARYMSEKVFARAVQAAEIRKQYA